jgi:hypothetical protein
MAVMTTALLLLPSTALSAPMPTTGAETNTSNTLLNGARQFRDAGEWGLACLWYDNYLCRERNQPEVKKEFLLCLRNYYRAYRHGDSSFRQQVLGPDFKVAQALTFYEEVLTKLQKNYVDTEKAPLGLLFREGITEIRLSLEDKSFLKQYVPDSRMNKLPALLDSLKKKQTESTSFITPAGAAREVARVSREVAEQLGIDRRVVIVEFACGACNALDEWTFYASPGALYAGRDEKSVFIDTDFLAEKKIDGIGVIRITHFQETTPQEFEVAFEALKSKGMQVLILDLRDNRGGSVEAAVEVARRFLPDGAQIATTSGKTNTTYQSYSMAPLTLPVFALVNSSTASAAELLAAALKSHKRAELVGQATYGKSWVQQTFSVTQAPHGALCITGSQFFVPNAPDLNKGIAPTIPVDAGAGDKRVIEVAVDRARTFVVTMMR